MLWLLRTMKRGRRNTRMLSNRVLQPVRQYPLASDLSPFSRRWVLFSVILFAISAPIVWIFSRPFSLRVSTTIYAADVVSSYPHDRKAFTQGLVYAGNDTLFESTGLYGQSSIRKVNLQTGKVESLHRMEHSYFGEGLTLFGERLIQVTWLQNTGFVYDRNNLSELGKFVHEMQDGWGLATDGKILFGTDGTSTLYHIDPRSLKVMRKYIVKYKNKQVHYLNELEFVNGEIWANVWQTDCIARISYKDGAVLGWVILSNLSEGLLAAGERDLDVLNGIAWDGNNNRIYVTGKLWPRLYEIKLRPWKKSPSEVENLCMPRSHRF